MDIETVGVIGAGVMGRGVAAQLLATSHRVVLVDVSSETLEQAVAEIRTTVRLGRLFRTSPVASGSHNPMDRLTISADIGAASGVDFVIENVTERWEVKREVYEALDRVCRDETVFAANTSAIEIARIAAATGRPDRVLGMHFMNPVYAKPTVEMIRARATSESTLDRARTLLRQMGKDAIVVGDAPGFVSNRVLMLTINEAIRVVEEGIASSEDVDRLFRTCFGHKMGPLETADLIGLDTILLSLEVLAETRDRDHFAAASLLRDLVAQGRLGRKSGRGFYSYDTLPNASAAASSS